MLRRLFAFLTVSCLLAPLALASKQSTNQDLQSMLTRVKPAIVNISVIRQNHEPASSTKPMRPHPDKTMTVGSGVILSSKHGMIITNAHVVDQAQLIVVTLQDGRRFVANTIGQDNNFDIAVIHIKAKHLTSIQFANSGSVRVGDPVVAIGSPFGLTETVTSGVVSALNRSALSSTDGLQDLIQTDTPINMGNSGGGLINHKGELIGINTAIITPNNGSIGIGFAIPSDIAHAVALQLIKFGKVKRGLLGVIVQDTTEELTEVLQLNHHKGALVSEIIPGSAADKAKLRPLDLIVSVDGYPTQDAGELHNLLAVTPPKKPITLRVQRGNKTLSIKAITGSPNDKLESHALPFLHGTTLRETRRILPATDTISNGILISGVGQSSPASLAGIAPGDVILAANRTPTPSLKALLSVLHKKSDRLLLTLSRGGHDLYVVLEDDK